MNCEDYNEAIGDLLDGTLDAARQAALDVHLAECAACDALVADLRAIRAATARLPMHAPPARIWERLATRLPAAAPGEPSRERGSFFSTLFAPRWRLAWSGGLAAAVALTVFIAVLPQLRPVVPTTAPTTTAKSETAVHADGSDLVQSVESELQAATQHYQKAIGGLEQMAQAGQGSLDPQVAGAIRQNLTVLDKAISESRTALQNQPTNELAQESLFEAFRRKVGLLQDTVALINEMRKGNQAEAAKILGNLNKS